MENTPNSTIHKQQVEKSQKEIENGRITLASNKTLNKIRFEMRTQKDLHADDMYDLQLKAENKIIKNVAEIKAFISKPNESQSRFAVTLTSDQQLKILAKECKKYDGIRLLLDGTGKITRNIRENAPSTLHHVLLLAIPKKGRDEESYLYPIAELVTNDSTSNNLLNFLEITLQRLQNIDGSATRIAAEIGTDFCWANINAIIRTNKISVKEYLAECFVVYSTNIVSDRFKTYTVPLSCFGHLSKNLKKDIDSCYESHKNRNFVASLLGGCVKIQIAEELNEYVNNILTLLASEKMGQKFDDSVNKLRKHFQDNQKPQREDNQVDADYDFTKENSIYKDSRFYQHFSRFVDSLEQSQVGKENELYSPTFVKLFLRKYLAFLPFWTLFVTSSRSAGPATRNNNARVERHFRAIKDHVDEKSLASGKLGNVKLGRYVEILQDYVDTLSAEITMDLGPHLSQRNPKSKKTQHINNTLSQWNKKGRGRSKVFLNENHRKPLFE